MFYRTCLIIVLITCKVYCQNSTVSQQLDTYESSVNSSLHLDKQDRLLIKTWKQDAQVKVVNITTEYRLQMTRHKEHSFRKKFNNERWRICLNSESAKTKKIEQNYYEKETGCLKVASSADEEKTIAVDQVEREIRKWRKSYRYLKNLCHNQHPDDGEKAGMCLVEFMKKDNYDRTFERLILLKLDAMKDLFNAMLTAVSNLEECLKIQFSAYLENVRKIMEELSRCYVKRQLTYDKNN